MNPIYASNSNTKGLTIKLERKIEMKFSEKKFIP